MDKTALVTGDREAEGLVIAALSRARIPAIAVEWNWVPDADEWQLTVVSPLFDTKGPRESYSQILEALRQLKVYESVPILKLFVKSPEAPEAKDLVRQLKLVKEGSIHIVKNPATPHQPKYAVVFAPYLGSGGPIPSVHLLDDQALRDFLEKRLGISSYEVDRAISELARKRSTSIFNVQLNLRQARRLNLAA
jgi:hypothetical protein